MAMNSQQCYLTCPCLSTHLRTACSTSSAALHDHDQVSTNCRRSTRMMCQRYACRCGVQIIAAAIEKLYCIINVAEAGVLIILIIVPLVGYDTYKWPLHTLWRKGFP